MIDFNDYAKEYIECKARQETTKELKEKYDGNLAVHFDISGKVYFQFADKPYLSSGYILHLDEEYKDLYQRKVRKITERIMERLMKEEEE